MSRPRRLLVLVRGLPPEAATYRHDRLPPAEEYAALMLERHDAWSRTLVEALMGAKRVQMPAQIVLERPGASRPQQNIVTDPGELRRWFAKHA